MKQLGSSKRRDFRLMGLFATLGRKKIEKDWFVKPSKSTVN
jgi:hypothetical protein